MTPYYQDDLVTLYNGDCREIVEWVHDWVLTAFGPKVERSAVIAIAFFDLDADATLSLFGGAA